MTIHQISVFLENKTGQLAEIAHILSEKHVNMRAASIAETTNYGVLRMIVDDVEKASQGLLEHNFILRETPVVGITVPDVPGGLSRVLCLISEAGINVEYMYSVFGQQQGQVCMIFCVEDLEGLVAILENNGISTIAEEALGFH